MTTTTLLRVPQYRHTLFFEQQGPAEQALTWLQEHAEITRFYRESDSYVRAYDLRMSTPYECVILTADELDEETRDQISRVCQPFRTSFNFPLQREHDLLTSIKQYPDARYHATLSPKHVCAGLKKLKTDIVVNRYQDEYQFLLSTQYMVVKVLRHPDLFPFVDFNGEWDRATFHGGNGPAVQGGMETVELWEQYGGYEGKPLCLTDEKKEIPDGPRGKPGTEYRKFVYEDELGIQRVAFYARKYLDVLSPDLSELQEFTFFHVEGTPRVMRVMCNDGIVAYIMPRVMTE